MSGLVRLTFSAVKVDLQYDGWYQYAVCEKELTLIDSKWLVRPAEMGTV